MATAQLEQTAKIPIYRMLESAVVLSWRDLVETSPQDLIGGRISGAFDQTGGPWKGETSMKDIRELSYGRMKLWPLGDEEPQSLEAPEDHRRDDEGIENASRNTRDKDA